MVFKMAVKEKNKSQLKGEAKTGITFWDSCPLCKLGRKFGKEIKKFNNRK
jgi:hypothetical protein